MLTLNTISQKCILQEYIFLPNPTEAFKLMQSAALNGLVVAQGSWASFTAKEWVQQKIHPWHSSGLIRPPRTMMVVPIIYLLRHISGEMERRKIVIWPSLKLKKLYPSEFQKHLFGGGFVIFGRYKK